MNARIDKPTETGTTESRVKHLVERLGDPDGYVRQDARRELVRIGAAGLTELHAALHDRNARRRWEASKTLGRIRDPRSGPPLVEALRDRTPEIRWLAAEGLIALEEAAVAPLLGALEKNGDSPSLRHGAHHVLHALERRNRLPVPVLDVLNSLRGIEPGVTVPVAAHTALASLPPSFLVGSDEDGDGAPRKE
jgi:HEAT repeat protein